MPDLKILLQLTLGTRPKVEPAPALEPDPARRPAPVVNPSIAASIGWGVMLGDNGDICVCVLPFSSSEPMKAAVSVHRSPVAARHGPASPFMLAVRYADGTTQRRVLSPPTTRRRRACRRRPPWS